MNNRPTIGVRMPPWAHSTWLVLGGIMDYIRANTTWRIETEDNSYGEMESIEIGIGWKGDAVILYRATEEELAYFKSQEIAVCLLSSEGPDLGYPRVIPDNVEVGRIAASHLLETGTQQFGYLARSQTLYQEDQFTPGDRVYSRERLKGYRTALQNSGFQPHVHYIKGYPLWKKNTWIKIENEVTQYLLSLPKQTAVFVVDDALAYVALRAAEKAGISVPEDLLILGYGNNINFCHASVPSMSSIVYPARTIGRKAASIIEEQLNNSDSMPPSILIKCDKIKSRESTAFIAIDDPEVAHLVKWIRLQAPIEAIQVADLIDHTRYSLSSIKTKFKEYLGYSPKEEIKRVRLAHLKFLLEDKNKSFSEISQEMDFRSTEEMSRFFLREHGVRPSLFRQQITSHQSVNE